MDSYPKSFVPQHQVPEAQVLKDLSDESGHPTPTHGGMVTGMEYDMAINSRSPNRDVSPLRPAATPATNRPSTPSKSPAPPASTTDEADAQTSTTAAEGPEQPIAPTPRIQSINGSRQRPVSMPPQSYASSTATSEPRSSRNHDSQHRSKQTGRVLGSYTMTKTLGAGSMGKVKLSVHNQTGEKVRRCMFIDSASFTSNIVNFSLRSKSCQELPLFPPNTMIQTSPRPVPHSLRSRMPKSCLRKFAQYGKRRCPCCFTTPIYAACEK